MGRYYTGITLIPWVCCFSKDRFLCSFCGNTMAEAVRVSGHRLPGPRFRSCLFSLPVCQDVLAVIAISHFVHITVTLTLPAHFTEDTASSWWVHSDNELCVSHGMSAYTARDQYHVSQRRSVEVELSGHQRMIDYWVAYVARYAFIMVCRLGWLALLITRVWDDEAM